MIKKDDYASFGKVLIKLQFLETIIKLYISLFNKNIKNNKEYGIKKLSTKNILEDNDNSKKTLGNLMRVIKNEIPQFDNKEFEKLLKMRNTFIHNFHKEFLSANAKKENELSEFIITLFNLTNKYTKIFTGLTSISITSLSKGKISTDGISDSEDDLIKYILDQNNESNKN